VGYLTQSRREDSLCDSVSVCQLIGQYSLAACQLPQLSAHVVCFFGSSLACRRKRHESDTRGPRLAAAPAIVASINVHSG